MSGITSEQEELSQKIKKLETLYEKIGFPPEKFADGYNHYPWKIFEGMKRYLEMSIQSRFKGSYYDRLNYIYMGRYSIDMYTELRDIYNYLKKHSTDEKVAQLDALVEQFKQFVQPVSQNTADQIDLEYFGGGVAP